MNDSSNKAAGTNRRACWVPRCIAKAKDKRSYHYFPKHKKIREQWISACNLDETAVSTYASICSAHFRRDDYLTSIDSKRQVLRPSAVPSLNLPCYLPLKVIASEIVSSEKDKSIENRIMDDAKSSGNDEKVTTIIYVPSNCPKIIKKPSNFRIGLIKKVDTDITTKQNETKNISGLEENTFDALQNSNPMKVFVHKKNNKIIQNQSNTNIQNQDYTNYKQKNIITIQDQNIDAHEENDESIQGQDNVVPQKGVSDRNVKKKEENVNIAIKKRTNKSSILKKKNSVQIKPKPEYLRGVSAITLCADCGQYCKIEDSDLFDISLKNAETLAAEILLELQEVNPSSEDERILLTKKGIEICDKALQKQNINLMNLITNDTELMAFTGINFEILNKLTKIATTFEGKTMDKYSCSVRDRIVICLCKLRTNLPFRCLAVMFGIKELVCSNNFFLMLRTISALLDKTIYWPKTEELLKNLPKCFQSFKQTRVILNCSEIEIEKQRCLKCRIEHLANKKCETVKFVLGIAPSGLIMFKSNIFDGQATDTSIFTQTNILELLDPAREAIMADKSLNIETDCSERNVTLIKPPKLENKRFSKNDVELIKNMAAARIHVDRTLQRFKMFKILQSKLSWRILPYADHVFTIIAGIVNLRNPVPPDESCLELVIRK